MVKTIEGLVEEISTLLDRGEVGIPEYQLNSLESGKDKVTNKDYLSLGYSHDDCIDCYSCNCYSCICHR